MTVSKTLYVTSRAEWRAWLAQHHDSETEVWLIYCKKHTGQPRIPYEDAVEEALCFGWIDSTIKRIDDMKFAQKFTPRRSRSNWSALNKRRARELMRNGRMTEAGLAKIDLATVAEEPEAKQSKPDGILPRFIRRALTENPRAWERFQNLAPSHRRNYIRWITNAKKQETRQRRLREAIAMLRQNRKLGMK